MSRPGRDFGLLFTLVRTDFKSRYHGTLGGFLWALIKPTTMFLVLMGVFSLIFAGNPAYKFNLVIGLFIWDFFAEGTKVGLGALQQRGYLITKAHCPLSVLVVSALGNAALTLGVFASITILFVAVKTGLPALPMIGLFIWYLIQLAGIVIGFSLAASVLFFRYRDLNQVWEVVLQAGFFLAPIIYPLEILPHSVHFLLYIWPVTPVIQYSRQVLIAQTAPSLVAHALLFGVTIAILGVGALIFRKYSPRVAEQLG